MVLFNLALTAQIQSELRIGRISRIRAEVSELLTEQKFNRLFYVET
jgi:hypothetical protein